MSMTTLLALLVAAAQAADCRPTVLVDQARIYTMNSAMPRAEAMVLDSCGALVAVGAGRALRLAYPQVPAIDAGGATIVPGLIDAHGHLMNLGYKLLRADLVGSASKDESLARLEQFAQSLPADAWLLGRGWDQNDWPDKQYPTRQDLDRLFPDRPVWLMRIDGHAGWANSVAIAQADRDFGGDWDIEGGEIHRDASGQPTGIFVDQAMALIHDQIPRNSESQEREALRAALKRTAASGLTGVHEAGTSQQQLRRYLEFAANDQLPIRIYAMADGPLALRDQLCTGTVVTDRVVARSVKIYADGALGSRGAALLEPYADRSESRGLLLQSPEQLAQQVDLAMACGLQVNIHAIGDRANRLALDLLAEGMASHPQNPGRHRIEHAQVLHEDDIARFAAHQIIASVQPTHATSDMYWALERLGEQRLAGAYVWQGLVRSGARLALGSDFPVELVSPIVGFYAAVARRDTAGWPADGWFAEQSLSRAQALHGFTLGAAYAAFMEQNVGSLETGKRADFVVLSQDLMALPPSALPATQVLLTVLDGEVIYRDPAAAPAWQTLPDSSALE